MSRPMPVTPVEATISAAEAANNDWEVIVIGAGPAGSAAALRLAARGLRVLLIDAAAMPRPKLCGCCLSVAAVKELAALEQIDTRGGVPDERARLPQPLPLERVRLATAAVTAALPLPGGGVISREALDTAAVRAAIVAGAAWLPETRVTAVTENPAAARVTLTARTTISRHAEQVVASAGLVVVAAGLADTVRIGTGQYRGEKRITPGSRLGLGATLPPAAGGPPPGELVMAVSRHGYCGLVRLEDGRVDIAAAVDRSLVTRAGGPAGALAKLLTDAGGYQAAGLFADADEWFAAAVIRGTPPLTRRQPVASAGGRVLRVGDAAGYVEPFTGEGMGWALASARFLDETVGRTVSAAGRIGDSPRKAAVSYAQAHRRHFAVHHARCRRVALVVRQPWLVGPALRLARLAPAVAARVVPLVVGAAARGKAHG